MDKYLKEMDAMAIKTLDWELYNDPKLISNLVKDFYIKTLKKNTLAWISPWSKSIEIFKVL